MTMKQKNIDDSQTHDDRDHLHEEHSHNHPHRKIVSRRVAIILGHLKGVQRMIDEGEDCCEILDQMSAIRSALNNSARILLDDHIRHCLFQAYEKNDTEMIERINSALKKYTNL
jgi:DNA-binding FrmR family transcriptional regulator